MTHHHIYGGSNAETWMNCNGSPYLSKLVNFKANEPMKRGTRIHEQAAQFILGSTECSLIEEERLVAQTYANAVRSNFSGMLVEYYIPQSPEVGGTIDGVFEDVTSISLWDLKTGHTMVPAENNYQLLFYLYLYCKDMEITKHVRLGIWHEAVMDFYWWSPTTAEILAAFAKFKDAIQRDKELIAGPQCIKCNARGICNKVVPLPVTKDEARIANDYEKIPLWKAVISGIENAAESLCINDNLPGYTMAYGNKKALKWNGKPPRQIGNLDVYKEEPMTPTQVAKLLGKDGESFIVSCALAARPESEKVITRI